MSATLDDHNIFDRYAAQAGWYYDNGWRYQDESWDAYRRAGFGVEDYLVILRKARRTVVLHYISENIHEIWSGQIATEDDFDKLVNFLNNYMA